MNVTSNVTAVVLSNLTVGKTYYIKVAAFTKVGGSEWSSPVKISMDPHSSDLTSSLDISDDDGSPEILKEVWFIILMGILLFIFLLLLVLILYTKRKSHGKKDHISSKEDYFIVPCTNQLTKLTQWKQNVCIALCLVRYE